MDKRDILTTTSESHNLPKYELNILETVMNISVDSRLAEKGLGKEKRRENFHELIGFFCGFPYFCPGLEY